MVSRVHKPRAYSTQVEERGAPMTKAVAYVNDIILGCTGEVIKRSCQAELIKQFAADNEIEIVATR